MRTSLAVTGLLLVALAMAGCRPEPVAAAAPPPTAVPTASVPAPTPTTTPAPTPSASVAAPLAVAEAPELTLGYTNEQISDACIPAVEAQYEGATVMDASPNGPWVDAAAGTATFEWLTYVPDGVTWTTNTNTTFPALCSIDARNSGAPTVVYIGVSDL